MLTGARERPERYPGISPMGEMAGKFEIVSLPKAYTEADQARRDAIMKDLRDLQRSYQKAAEPYFKALTDIEMRYPPRIMLVPATVKLED